MNNEVKKLPLISLRGMTILPYMVIHFDVSRKKSIKAIDYAMKSGQMIFLATQKSADILEPDEKDVYDYGCVSEIRQIVKMSGGLVRVMVKGLYRARMNSFTTENDMLMAEITDIRNLFGVPDDNDKKARRAILLEQFENYLELTGRNKGEIIASIKASANYDEFVYRMTAECTDDYAERQDILSMEDASEKFDELIRLMNSEIEIIELKKKLNSKFKSAIDKNQKEYFLNEQLKVIKNELNEGEESEEDILKQKIMELDAPDYVLERLNREFRNFSLNKNHSSESQVIRNYIENLLALPWNEYTEENNNIIKAKKVLDKEHYGLTKVKERILEFLAVKMLSKDNEAPIICLVGPPGTGKTSIAASIARALNRKYVRICLGGVRDEAEIRGHRKTYIGAMPGRIIEGLKQAKAGNPLMLLDEIDKTGTDSRGDTASALLEILDSAQNHAFIDHYIEIPVDLSKCLFIATANDAGSIPKPLLDRMEIVEINSYTENEKYHIAKEYLVKKQIKKNGLKPSQISFTKDAIKTIIDSYTREAGVRELERVIGAVCRKAAVKIVGDGQDNHKVKANNIEDYLGIPKYDKEEGLKEPQVGVVKGLAWTAVGGTTLDVEACLMEGKGEISLTGKLGEVMKESAMVSRAYLRANAEKFGIDNELFEKKNLHIHIPEGAVPKDGPSAGITMTLAMYSAYTGKRIRADIAMTGEVTLLGKVLPIGGLKEKLLAAGKVGVKTVLVPYKNKKDVLDMDKEIIENLEIIYVTKMEEVIKEGVYNGN